jgi:hypothetical protein
MRDLPLVTCIATLVLTAGAAAEDWNEIGDAPESPAEAQPVTGCGAIETITGATSTGLDDFVDAYLIRITDVAAFHATTSSAMDPNASASWDTRLFLLTPDGSPVLANDDAPDGSGAQSYLSDPSTYPGSVGPTASPLSSGLYVLAITGWANDPEDADGSDLFAIGLEYLTLHGPAPGVGAYDHWENGHGLVQSGPYTIALAGASVVTTSDCPADIDGSGDVGFDDLLEVLSTWGPCAGCPADLDCNGDVGFNDLLVVLSTWGPCP